MDKRLKIFDIINFDVINMMRLDYIPGTVERIHGLGDAIHTLAVSDKESNKIHIYDTTATAAPLKVLEKIHMKPVYLIRYNPKYDVAVSVAKGGMLGKDLYEFVKKRNYTDRISIFARRKIICYNLHRQEGQFHHRKTSESHEQNAA